MTMRCRLRGLLLFAVLASAILHTGCKQGVDLPPPLQVTGGALANAVAGQAYTATIAPTNAFQPLTCEVIGGSLPPGLTLNASACVISGTPTAPGTFTFTVRMTDGAGRTVTESFTITVLGTLTITTTALPDGVRDRGYNFTLLATGGQGTLTWSVDPLTPLPAGLTLSAAGVLSGTPTVSGTFNFGVQVQDTGTPPQAVTQTVTLVLQPPLMIVNTLLPNGFANVAYEQILSATGGIPGYMWSVVDSLLDPPGLDFTVASPSTGTYGGTPTTPGSYTFTIRVTDTGNAAVTSAFAETTFTVLILGAPGAYVANSGDGTVSVVDIATNTVVATIVVGTGPTGIALSPDAIRAYVTNNGDGTVSVIDTLSNMVTTTITVGTSPVGIVAPSDGVSVYVANQGSNSVSIIDTATNTVTVTLSMPVPGSEPTGLAASPNGRLLFLTLRGINKVFVINNDPGSPAFHTIIGQLDVGMAPTGISFAPVTSSVYVANSGDNTVSIISVDLAMLTFDVRKTLDVDMMPEGTGAGPECNTVHAVNSGANNVTVISAAGDEVVPPPVTVGAVPQQIAYTSDGVSAYVTNAGSNSVSVIDLATNTVSGTIMVGAAPKGIVITSDATLRLVPAPPATLPTGFVADPYAGRLCASGGLPPYTFMSTGGQVPPGLTVEMDGLISGTPTQASIPDFPGDFTFTVTVTDSSPAPQTASGDYLLQICCIGIPPHGYVANFDDNSVTVFETTFNNVVTTITSGIGLNPLGVAIAPNRNRTYVSNFNDDTVSVIDSDPTSGTFNTVLATVAVGDGPSGLAVTPDNLRVYVANENGGTVSVIDTTTNMVIATITVGFAPEGVAVRPDGARVYVANIFSSTVSVIDTATNTNLTDVMVGSGPVGLAVTPDGTRVYVTNQFGDNVSVIDTATDTVTGAPIPVGNFPTGIAITPGGTRAYVTNQLEDTVSEIDLSSNTEVDIEPATPTIDRIAVGTSPDFIAITEFGGRAYVTNFGAGTVSIIDINPGSMGFRTVIGTITTGRAPEGVRIQGGS